MAQPPTATTITDEEVPLATLPKTGGAVKKTSGMGGVLISLAALLGLKKKNNTSDD